MSIKQTLRQTVESLPESVTLEEAFDRLYAAFKMKQARSDPREPRSTSERAHVVSPRLAHPAQISDFAMEISTEEA